MMVGGCLRLVTCRTGAGVYPQQQPGCRQIVERVEHCRPGYRCPRAVHSSEDLLRAGVAAEIDQSLENGESGPSNSQARMAESILVY